VLWRVALVCCSVLQCIAVCCSVLQCVALCWSVLQCVAACAAAADGEGGMRFDVTHSCVT